MFVFVFAIVFTTCKPIKSNRNTKHFKSVSISKVALTEDATKAIDTNDILLLCCLFNAIENVKKRNQR